MFSAMVLACVLNPDGTLNYQNCRGFASPYIWPDTDTCLQALGVGIATVEEQGWAVMDYECFDWKEKKGKAL
jgi:hypothetical protein